MNDTIAKLNNLKSELEKAKQYFFDNIDKKKEPIQIYTHIDTDGLTSGAILGKALYREGLPFQIRILRQLEKEEIEKIAEKINPFNNFLIFSDFGSGQYLELMKSLNINGKSHPMIILDHHIPQNISNKEESDLIKEIREKTSPWHINPYFYGIDGSTEISSAGICYYFAMSLNSQNIDLSPIAIIGAIGDIQNQENNKSFKGINLHILEDAKNNGYIEVINDLNFSSVKPLNEAIAYSSDINLPGLTNHVNKTLKFLRTLGILMENPDGSIRTLKELNQDEKQKLSSAIIEYSSLKLDIEPHEIIEKLIVNKYILKNESPESILYDSLEFSNLLNSCGRTDNGSLGIAIAMGDRGEVYKKAQETLINYKKLVAQALSWIFEKNKIQQKEYIQYFFGEDVIPENIVGTISSMLIFDKSEKINKSKPIFGLAKREGENVYKVSARAHESIVNKGINLSEAIREACILSNLDVLGGGHPPAAGTKIPTDMIDIFLDNCNKIIKKQIELS
ncbi:MAG: DHH family phosphoesterase [Promethearchaeota archaeon]